MRNNPLFVYLSGIVPSSNRVNGSLLTVLACSVTISFGCSIRNDKEPLPGKNAGESFQIPVTPETYVCYRTETPPIIDGSINEEPWDRAEWTKPFVDITGNVENQPAQQTRVKMLWDDAYFYVAAELEEKHVWATLRQRDTVIYFDNDFEIFIDPDGDTHLYYELEVNAFGTAWDLLMVKPYRDGGPAITGWNINGLRVEVTVEGTINNPEAEDRNWTVEIAMPWQTLAECAPGRRKPADGDYWRMNFSRVDWEMVVTDGNYRKRENPETGEILSPMNRVWSPQEEINMHAPETWGYVQFSDCIVGEKTVPFVPEKDEEIKWVLRKLYYLQRSHFKYYGEYAASLKDLGLHKEDFHDFPALPQISATHSIYKITMQGYDSGPAWHITQEGRVWQSMQNRKKILN